jgi:hypothetical protein
MNNSSPKTYISKTSFSTKPTPTNLILNPPNSTQLPNNSSNHPTPVSPATNHQNASTPLDSTNPHVTHHLMVHNQFKTVTKKMIWQCGPSNTETNTFKKNSTTCKISTIDNKIPSPKSWVPNNGKTGSTVKSPPVTKTSTFSCWESSPLSYSNDPFVSCFYFNPKNTILKTSSDI